MLRATFCIHILRTHARALSQTHLDKKLICNSRTGKAFNVSNCYLHCPMLRATSNAQTKGSILDGHVSMSENLLLQAKNRKQTRFQHHQLPLTAPERWMLRATIMCTICFYTSVSVLSFSAETRRATKLPFTAVCCQDATSMYVICTAMASCLSGRVCSVTSLSCGVLLLLTKEIRHHAKLCSTSKAQAACV